MYPYIQIFNYMPAINPGLKGHGIYNLRLITLQDTKKCQKVPVAPMYCQKVPVAPMYCQKVPVAPMYCQKVPVASMYCQKVPVAPIVLSKGARGIHSTVKRCPWHP